MLALLKLFVVGLGCEYQGAMGSAPVAASPVKADPWACACLPQVDLMGPGAKFYRRLAADVTPTFEVAHRTLYGKPSTQSVYTEWKNCAGKKPSTSYTHTNINQSFADWIVREIQPRFVVEVGSFTGLSSVRFGKALVNAGLRQRSFLLCIDTWLGDLNMLLNKRDFAASLSWRAGEPELYDQWVAHIVAAGLQDVVLPLRQTSLLGARFLKAVRWQADLVFLDSAHEVDETFAELVLFWDRVRPGGILLGDDYVWRAVRHDVRKFVHLLRLPLVRPSELLWYIRKPPQWSWPEGIFRRSLGYYGENKDVFVFDSAKALKYRALLEAEHPQEEPLAPDTR
jgi:predicted O-methyltransferase YrrM